MLRCFGLRSFCPKRSLVLLVLPSKTLALERCNTTLKCCIGMQSARNFIRLADSGFARRHCDNRSRDLNPKDSTPKRQRARLVAILTDTTEIVATCI